nr:protein E6A [Equid gammaherpesvirus 5]
MWVWEREKRGGPFAAPLYPPKPLLTPHYSLVELIERQLGSHPQRAIRPGTFSPRDPRRSDNTHPLRLISNGGFASAIAWLVPLIARHAQS